ncbi:hypothetical protein SAMN05216489_01348 [Streptomyces sp. 3213]|uniref:DUF2255 family protein n=1 Tax=Streptomyces sp. 3213.3 TaxID=1855348 RepID=UPI0008999779|nr:DUF2255 family protein [Streptomyces sp. 3213.3]SEC68048.1 hypothetical protein SAMN05216489_01348 [Streptomyces sp. 3213] [Streptomyces sp. 3213.3]
MTTWDAARLRSLAAADDLHISPYRKDGRTYGTPTWIWSGMVSGALYVRPYNGPDSRWYRAALSQKAGRIRIGGTEHEVAFTPADDTVLEAVDDARAPQPPTHGHTLESTPCPHRAPQAPALTPPP